MKTYTCNACGKEFPNCPELAHHIADTQDAKHYETKIINWALRYLDKKGEIPNPLKPPEPQGELAKLDLETEQLRAQGDNLEEKIRVLKLQQELAELKPKPKPPEKS